MVLGVLYSVYILGQTLQRLQVRLALGSHAVGMKSTLRCSYCMCRNGPAKQCTDTNHFTSHFTHAHPCNDSKTIPARPPVLTPTCHPHADARCQLLHSIQTTPTNAIDRRSQPLATVSVPVVYSALRLRAMPSTEEAGACSCEWLGGSTEVAWVL